MFFFDFIFGNRDGGSFKVLFFSGMIGLTIAYLGFGDFDEGGRHYFVLLGFPIWLIIRAAYWGAREEALLELKHQVSTSSGPEKLVLETKLRKAAKSVATNNFELSEKLMPY